MRLNVARVGGRKWTRGASKRRTLKETSGRSTQFSRPPVQIRVATWGVDGQITTFQGLVVFVPNVDEHLIVHAQRRQNIGHAHSQRKDAVSLIALDGIVEQNVPRLRCPLDGQLHVVSRRCLKGHGRMRMAAARAKSTPLVVLPSASRNAVQGVPCFPSMKRR